MRFELFLEGNTIESEKFALIGVKRKDDSIAKQMFLYFRDSNTDDTLKETPTQVHKCFPINTARLKNICERLLLKVAIYNFASFPKNQSRSHWPNLQYHKELISFL